MIASVFVDKGASAAPPAAVRCASEVTELLVGFPVEELELETVDQRKKIWLREIVHTSAA